MGTQYLLDIIYVRMYAHTLRPAALWLGHIYIRQIPLSHAITITYNLQWNIKSSSFTAIMVKKFSECQPVTYIAIAYPFGLP